MTQASQAETPLSAQQGHPVERRAGAQPEGGSTGCDDSPHTFSLVTALPSGLASEWHREGVTAEGAGGEAATPSSRHTTGPNSPKKQQRAGKTSGLNEKGLGWRGGFWCIYL